MHDMSTLMQGGESLHLISIVHGCYGLDFNTRGLGSHSVPFATQFDGQLGENRALCIRAATAAGGDQIRVGSLKEFGHEAQTSLTDVRAAGKHVQDGVHAAANEGERRHGGTSRYCHC